MTSPGNNKFPFAVIVPIVPRTPKVSFAEQVAAVEDITDHGAKKNLCKDKAKEMDAVEDDECSQSVRFENCPNIAQGLVLESLGEETVDSPASANVGYSPESTTSLVYLHEIDDGQGKRNRGEETHVQGEVVEREDNVEDNRSDDDGEGRVVREISVAHDDDGDMLYRDGAKEKEDLPFSQLVEITEVGEGVVDVNENASLEEVDPDCLEAPYLEVCATNPSISILFLSFDVLLSPNSGTEAQDEGAWRDGQGAGKAS
jgi:hypothetical protein